MNLTFAVYVKLLKLSIFITQQEPEEHSLQKRRSVWAWSARNSPSFVARVSRYTSAIRLSSLAWKTRSDNGCSAGWLSKKLCRKWALRTFSVVESTNSQQLSIDYILTDHRSVVKCSKLRSETLISPVDLPEYFDAISMVSYECRQ